MNSPDPFHRVREIAEYATGIFRIHQGMIRPDMAVGIGHRLNLLRCSNTAPELLQTLHLVRADLTTTLLANPSPQINRNQVSACIEAINLLTNNSPSTPHSSDRLPAVPPLQHPSTHSSARLNAVSPATFHPPTYQQHSGVIHPSTLAQSSARLPVVSAPFSSIAVSDPLLSGTSDQKFLQAVRTYYQSSIDAPTAPPRISAEDIQSMAPHFKQLGFTLKKHIGQGAMGVVFLARDDELDRDVAIKVILKSGLGPDTKKEARLGGRFVDDDPVVMVFKTGIIAGTFPYQIMRYVKNGRDLDDLPGELNRVARLVISTKMIRAVNSLHIKTKTNDDDEEVPNGVLHRDIKPANFLGVGIKNGEISELRRSLKIYAADLGLARELSKPEEDIPGRFAGTPVFASPEQATKGPLTEKSDVWSLAVSIYHVLTGHYPFPQEVMDNASMILPYLRDFSEDSFISADDPLLSKYPQPIREELALMTSRLPTDRPTAAESLAVFEADLDARMPEVKEAAAAKQREEEAIQGHRRSNRLVGMAIAATLTIGVPVGLTIFSNIRQASARKAALETFSREHSMSMKTAEELMATNAWSKAIGLLEARIKSISDNGFLEAIERKKLLNLAQSHLDNARSSLAARDQVHQVISEADALLAKDTLHILVTGIAELEAQIKRNKDEGKPVLDEQRALDDLYDRYANLNPHEDAYFESAVSRLESVRILSPEKSQEVSNKLREVNTHRCRSAYRRGMRAYHRAEVEKGVADFELVQKLGVEEIPGDQGNRVAFFLEKLRNWKVREKELDDEVSRALGWTYQGQGSKKKITISETVADEKQWIRELCTWLEKAKSGDADSITKILYLYRRIHTAVDGMMTHLKKTPDIQNKKMKRMLEREGARFGQICQILHEHIHLFLNSDSMNPDFENDLSYTLVSLMTLSMTNVENLNPDDPSASIAQIPIEQRNERRKRTMLNQLQSASFLIPRMRNDNFHQNLTLASVRQGAQRSWSMLDHKMSLEEKSSLKALVLSNKDINPSLIDSLQEKSKGQ